MVWKLYELMYQEVISTKTKLQLSRWEMKICMAILQYCWWFLGSANNCNILIDCSLALNCDHVFHLCSRLTQSSRYDPGLLWSDFATQLHFELAMNDCCVPNCYALPNTDRICFFPMIWQEQAAWIVDWWVYQTSGWYLPTCKYFFLLLSTSVNT